MIAGNPDPPTDSFPCIKCGEIYTEESGASKGFTCDDCLDDVFEDEGTNIADNEEEWRLPELMQYQGKEDNRMIKRPHIFHTTAHAYGDLTGSPMNVKISAVTHGLLTDYISSRKGEKHEVTGTTIFIPKDPNDTIENEDDAYSWYLMREVYRKLFDSDDRNRLAVHRRLISDKMIPHLKKAQIEQLRGDGNHNETYLYEQERTAKEKLVDIVYNCVEDARVESLGGELFYGTGADIERLNKEIPKTTASSELETLVCVKMGRRDLVPPQYEELAKFFEEWLQKVNKSTPIATMLATRAIATRILNTIEPPVIPPVPPKGKKKKGEGGTGGGVCIGKGESQKGEGEGEEEEPEGEEGDNDNDNEEEQEEEKPEPEQTEAEKKKETQQKENDAYNRKRELQRQVYTAKSGKEVSGIGTNKTIQSDNREDAVWQKDVEAQLEGEKQKGADKIDQVRKDLMKRKQQQMDSISSIGSAGYANGKVGDEAVQERDKPVTIGTPDRKMAQMLSDVFKRIKTKRTWRSAEYGTQINIDNIIKREAGGDENKLFNRRHTEAGLDITFCIDCSGSMDSYMPNGDEPKMTRMDGARQLLLTMLAATKDILNVRTTVFAYGEMTDSKYVAEKGDDYYGACRDVAKLTPDKVTTLTSNGGTPMGAAIFAAITHIKSHSSASRRNLLINITDGSPDNQDLVTRMMELLKKSNIEVHNILLNEDSYTNEERTQMMNESYAKMFGRDTFTWIKDLSKLRRMVTDIVATRIMAILAV